MPRCIYVPTEIEDEKVEDELEKEAKQETTVLDKDHSASSEVDDESWGTTTTSGQKST
jgi:hypothetical protein